MWIVRWGWSSVLQNCGAILLSTETGVVHRGMLREYSSIREQVLATTQRWLNAMVKEVLVTGTSAPRGWWKKVGVCQCCSLPWSTCEIKLISLLVFRVWGCFCLWTLWTLQRHKKGCLGSAKWAGIWSLVKSVHSPIEAFLFSTPFLSESRALK